MLLGIVPLSALASENPMTINISSESGLAGTLVTTKITLKDNPGISSLKLNISYDSFLTLEDVKFNDEMGGIFQEPQKYTSPVTLNWASPTANYSLDTTFATLTFRISEDADENTVSKIKVTYNPDDIYNMDENNIDCTVVDGTVTVVSCKPGDVNGDQKVNNKDFTRLFQKLSGWDVVVNEFCLDVNNDGSINNKDATRLFQYLANWDVEIFCACGSSKICTHSMKSHPAVSKTCTKAGNIAYWECTLCNKYFSDASGKIEVALADTVIPAGHSLTHVEPVAATSSTEGCIEHWKCSACGKYYGDSAGTKELTKADVTIPVLQRETYSITYHISNGDEYLAQQYIENNNPETYTAEEGVAKFSNPSVPGYTFLGWYDLPSGEAAENIKSIPVGSTGNVDLYAKWEKLSYKVNFSSDLISVPSETYTVDEEHVLPSPKLDGYIFVGWSDDDGNVIKNIPEGTVGTKTYTANWLSERNQAWSKNELDAPVVYEDDETKTILFAYNIGEIRNVPVSVIHDFGKINSSGVTKTVTKEVSKTVSESCMETYTNTVQKATTDSFSWTLSNEWSDSVSVDEEWAKETGLTEGQINSKYRDDSNNWYVSSGSSGSSTTSEVSGSDTTSLKSSTKNRTDTESDTSTESGTVSAELKASMGSEVTGKIEAGISASVSTEDTHLDSTIKGKSSSNGTNTTTYGMKTTDTSSSWNKDSGYGGSSTVGQSETVSKELSEKLSEKYNIGKSYINTDSQSSTQDKVTSDTSTEEYSSSVTFSTVESETTTQTFTTENTVSGYHRWVMAGTAHVFAVVGYDIETASYFVTTYSIMDDEVYEYEDYSYLKASYDDNENSVIEFNVPYDEIVDYVANRIGKSEGLEISKDGIVTNYKGTDKCVLIPEYTVVDNKDGTNSVVKVSGISSTAFAGKNIEEIIFSDNITEIPDAAFKNCTSLKTISAIGITKIGKEAFWGCTSLGEMIIGEDVTELGNNIVSNNTKLGVVASNANVIKAATNSGAKEITIAISDKCNDLKNTDLSIPATCEYFAFYGYDKTFENLTIESNAKTSVINRVTITGNKQAPLRFNFDNVELHEVHVSAPGICLALTADKTNLALRGESTLTSVSENAMLCKKVSLSQIDDSQTTSLTINKNLLINPSSESIISGKSLLNVKGQIIAVTEDEYNNYLTGLFKVNFNANGGSVSETSKNVVYGTSYGTLPVPTRDYYTFNGWYTAASGGTKVTSDTIMNSTEDVTLYAQWTINPTSGWIKASELPAGAEIVNSKWSYDKTTNITSDKSYVEGYTLYNTTSAWGPYGAWSGWSNTAVAASDSRQVETKTIPATYKTVWHYSRSVNSNSSGNSTYAIGYYKYDQYITLDYRLAVKGSADGHSRYGSYAGEYGTYFQNFWWNEWSESVVATAAYNQYRYRDRSLVYTYHHTKTESLESTTEITANDTISNVQKWVQYRAK